MNPPPYNFAASQSSVVWSPDDEPTHDNLGRPGRLAPKWLEDLLSGALRDDDADSSVLDVGCGLPSLHQNNTVDGWPDLMAPRSRHELLINGHQTYETKQNGQGDYEEYLSCICQNCRYHFVVHVTFPGAHQCGPSTENQQDPFHHLVWVGAGSTAPATQEKYHPVLGQVVYQCSSSFCRIKVIVEVSRPRLPEKFLDFLLDKDRITQRLRDAVAAEPERFADLRTMAPDPLTYLRIYLRDIIEGRKETKEDGTEVGKKIDKRNKKFYIQFGNDENCGELFRYLEFEEVTIDGSEVWRVPYPEIIRPTLIGSRLAFFQDVKSEVETILGRTKENMKPLPALDHIRDALRLGKSYMRTKAPWKQYNRQDYDTLGVPTDMHESLFWYAFTCQRQTDPANELRYFDAVRRLAAGRGNEDLEMRIMAYDSMKTVQPPPVQEDEEIRRATELSLKEAQQSTQHDGGLAGAYAYFGFNTPPETNDVLVGKFRNLCEVSPAQKSHHREKLLVIARETNNRALQERAIESMDADEAMVYLGVNQSSDNEYIVSTAQWLAQERDYLLVASALQIIDKARGGNTILTNAGAIIKAEREQSYRDAGSAMAIDGPADDGGPVNLELPAGLENMRNTCYLNSILQYLLTVKPIREIVLNWEKYALENTEENLEQRRVDPGSTRLGRGEAFAGQQFVNELRQLFDLLINTDRAYVKPTQKLALAALKNSNQLEKDGGDILAPKSKDSSKTGESSKEPQAPPLPLRHAPAPPVPPRMPQVTVNALSVGDTAETSSTVSSQTLVDQVDDEAPTASSVSLVAHHDSTGAAEKAAGGEAISGTAPTDIHINAQSDDVEMSNAADTTSGDAAEKDASGDVQMVDFPPPPSAPEPTVEEKIARALNDSSVTGTDQQDVEEVMGNIIDHLRAAIKATGEDPDTGVQTDPIMDTFYWTSVSYNRSKGVKEYSRHLDPNRCLTAFPDEREVISLQLALDKSFQREFIEGDNIMRFTSILKLPPILHVHIQRTAPNGGKNDTAIDIPTVLYLDRFMDSPVDSDLFRRRQRGWNLQERLLSLKGPNGVAVKEPSEPELGFLEAYNKSVMAEYSKDGEEEGEDDASAAEPRKKDYELITPEIRALMDSLGTEYPEPLSLASLATAAPSAGDDIDMIAGGITREQIRDAWEPDAVAAVLERSRDAEREVRRELDGLFAGMTQHEYRLHAVVCHAGQTGKSGHYWVWIYDFDRGVWRKYNDSSVTEEADAGKVMALLSSHGDPYYLAYVRAQDIDRMVGVPSRAAAAVVERPAAAAAAAALREEQQQPQQVEEGEEMEIRMEVKPGAEGEGDGPNAVNSSDPYAGQW